MLRISVTIGSLNILALGYLSVYRFALNPDFLFAPKAIGILGGAVTPMMILAIIATIRLRSEGLDGRSILMKALQQPRWWRSWYPRAFRRRGDVWSRLPHELRRFRLYFGIFQIHILTIFIPLQLMSLYDRHLRALGWVSYTIFFAAIALVSAERRRATKFVRAKVGATAAGASAILSTPTWRASTWRRAPTSTLLGGPPPCRPIEAPDAGDPLAPERPTQL
jgi:hypothetical protein